MANSMKPLSHSDPLYRYFVAMPDIGRNRLGNIVRDSIYGSIRKNLSSLLSDGVARYDLLSSITLTGGDLTTGILSTKFLTDFATVLAIQNIHYSVSDIDIDINKVRRKVKEMNESLKNHLVQFYSKALPFCLGFFTDNLDTAKQKYMNELQQDSWVNLHAAKYADHTWVHQSWELFHHWVKLSGLGATDHEIGILMHNLRQKGINIPVDVDENNWRKYFTWFSPRQFGYQDMNRDFSARKWHATYNYVYHRRILQQYLLPHESSCFTADTQVPMEDGSMKFIKDVKIGDSVQTPTGVRKVLLVSTPKRGYRIMYKINNLPFCFTGAHPFLNSSDSPRYLAASHISLLNGVPRLSLDGIGELKSGMSLLGKNQSKIIIDSLEEVEPGNPDECLYDLIVEPDKEGKFHYFAGSNDFVFAVGSEISSLADYNECELLSFGVIMRMIANCSQKLNELYRLAASHEQFLSKLMYIIYIMSARFLLNIKDEHLAAEGPSTLPDLINHVVAYCQDEEGSFNQACGAAYDYFMKGLFSQLAHTIELGWRVIPQNHSPEAKVLVLTLMDMHLTDSAPLFLSKPVVLVHALDQMPRTHLTKGDEAVKYGCLVHEMFFFSVGSVNVNDDSTTIKIELFCPTEKKVMLSAELTFYLHSDHAYKYYHLPLVDNNLVKHGFVNIDLRMLTEEQLELEKEAPKKWDNESKTRFGKRIQNACEKLLVEICEQDGKN